jgi:hypothetical protein
MQNKQKLKKLVEIIGQLLKIDGNEWLVDEILNTIGKSTSMEEISNHSTIQNIHEYCIEKKIEKQANEFYAYFPIEEIKQQLIQDYQKMEHERRRDDFKNFCLCVYQQIENITNYFFDEKIEKNWDSDKNLNTNIRMKSGRITVDDLIFQGNANKGWFANRKYRAVLYYYYFKKNIKSISFFNLLDYSFQEVYQMRNQNHRGNNPTDYQQNILESIKGNESKYYFKFYGFLQDFVSKIEDSFKESIESTNKQKNSH